MGDNGEEEDTAEAAQAIGEAACATVSLASPNGGTISAQSTSVGSLDDQYNATSTSASTCPNQFVVEITNTGAHPATEGGVDFGWDQPLPTNSTECASARSIAHWYGYNGSTWTTYQGKDLRHGVWNSIFSVCELVSSATYPQGSWTGATLSSYSKVRVAVQSWQNVGVKTDAKFAKISTKSPTPP